MTPVGGSAALSNVHSCPYGGEVGAAGAWQEEPPVGRKGPVLSALWMPSLRAGTVAVQSRASLQNGKDRAPPTGATLPSNIMAVGRVDWASCTAPLGAVLHCSGKSGPPWNSISPLKSSGCSSPSSLAPVASTSPWAGVAVLREKAALQLESSHTIKCISGSEVMCKHLISRDCWLLFRILTQNNLWLPPCPQRELLRQVEVSPKEDPYVLQSSRGRACSPQGSGCRRETAPCP